MWLKFSPGYINFETGIRWTVGTVAVGSDILWALRQGNNTIADYTFATQAEALAFLDSLVRRANVYP